MIPQFWQTISFLEKFACSGVELWLVKSFALCYNRITGTAHDSEGVVCYMLTADFFWKLFEATGSITAYLLYRELVSHVQ